MIELIYLPKRFSKEGRVSEEVLFEQGRTYEYFLSHATVLPEKFDDKKLTVIDEGRVITDFKKYPMRKAHIVVTPKIEWGAIVFVGQAIWAFALAHPYIFWATALSLSYSVYAAVTMRTRMPSFGMTGLGADEGSPTYGWDGAKQTSDVGIPINVCYGEYRIGGNVINEYVSTDGDKNYYHCLTCLGEGEIESIGEGQINKNPLENFEGYTVTTRMGTNTQTVIPGFENLHGLSDSLDVQLVKDDPYVYTTDNINVEEFEIHIWLPAGLYQTDTATGQLSAWAVTYRVEYKLHAAGSYTDLGTFTINEKSRSAIRRIFKKGGLTAGQYDIRITRTSDDSGDLTNGDLYLQYFDEIRYRDLRYPNRALVAIDALATNQLSTSAPNITWIVKGRKVRVPDVRTEAGSAGAPVDWDDYYWDPDDDLFRLFADGSALYWDEVTYTTAYSANPVWCTRDLMTNTRYGLGKFIDESLMDEDRLLEMALRCDTKVPDGSGGYEKRYRLDINIDTSAKALDLITQMTAVYDAFPYYGSGIIGLVVDKPISVPSQIFGMGNTIKNSFGLNYKSIADIPTVIEVSYNNKDKNYELDTILVQDATALEAGVYERIAKLRVFVTRTSHALRAGRYALYVAKYINRTLTLKAGIDAILCQVGDRIDYSHDVPLWGWSGRILADCTASTIYLDQEVTIESGKTYEVKVCYGADVIETRYVTNAVGTYNYLTLDTPLSAIPEDGATYHFGEENICDKPFRLISVERLNNDEAILTAIEYDERVYADDPVTLPPSTYTSLVMDTPPITDLVLTERLVKLGDGTIEDCIDVWFNKPSLIGSKYLWAYVKAKIYLSDDGGLSWVLRGETTGSSFAIVGGLVDGVEYTVAVTACSSQGGEKEVSISPQQSITLAGKSAPPADVAGFVVKQSRDRLYLTWASVADVDLSGYEIRKGTSWASGELVASTVRQNYLISLTIQTGALQDYWIKAMDTSGNYSETATQGILTVDNVPFTNVIESYSEQTAWAGTKVDTQVSGNNLIITPGSFLTGTYTTPVRDVGFVATFKIGIDAFATVSGDETWQDFGDQTFADMADTVRFSGAEIPGALTFEIRTSDDNVTWSAWETWQPADYTCRYFQLRMTMTRLSAGQALVCSQFDYYADLPDVDDFGTGEVTVAGDGAVITFNKEYHQIPSVNIDILSGDGFIHKFTTAPDLTDATIKLYALDGTTKTGTFRWASHGV